MKYMGSKNRIAKHILPIILKDRKQNQPYVEPFCGGLNTLAKVSGLRIAADNNKYLIAMWQGLQAGRTYPTDIEKSKYDRARTEFNNGTNLEFDDFMIGCIGWMGSFNGRFFDGGYSGKVGSRDYIDEQTRNIVKQIPLIKDVRFICCDYAQLLMPLSVIYCDPPYQGTKQYASSKEFNHKYFWDWCRGQIRAGHQVFISEYQAPDDFECIWEMEVTNALNTTKTYKPVERLFKLKGS